MPVNHRRCPGASGGRIRGRIAGGALDVGVGAAERPDLRLRAQDHDFFALLAGRENAEMLFMADRISIDGDLSLAVRIRTLFRARA